MTPSPESQLAASSHPPVVGKRVPLGGESTRGLPGCPPMFSAPFPPSLGSPAKFSRTGHKSRRPSFPPGFEEVGS